MTGELEVKFKVENHDAVSAALASTNAIRIGRVLETNHILDAKDGLLRAAGSALRVRTRSSFDTGGRDAILTFKGPVQRSQFKLREEREVDIGDADAALLILDRIGFVPIMVFEKVRETWRLGECTVELDEIPHCGRFVEIEGPSEPAIEHASRQLGLDATPSLRQTYVGLLARYCSDHAVANRRIVFPPGALPMVPPSPR